MASMALQNTRAPFIADFVRNPNYKSQFPNPTFEITGINCVEQDDGLVYRLNLSDGHHWMWGILVPDLHNLVDDKKIKVHNLIKLTSYYLETYEGKRFIAVEDLEVLPLQSNYANGITTAKQRLQNSTPSSEASFFSSVRPSNKASVSASASNREDVWNMKKRVMLGDIGDMGQLKEGEFLVVVLGKRKDKLDGKQDYYIWDSSSPVINGKLRKTILSVWRSLRDNFQPSPGTIVALRGVTKHKSYDEHPTEPRMIFKENMGHLNAWPSIISRDPSPWFLMDPIEVEGYKELKEAWEEQRYDMIDLEGDAIIQEMLSIGNF